MIELDFTDQFNTPLSSKREAQYQDWAKAQSEATGRDVSKDSYDYDMRGWFNEHDGESLKGGHLTDRYKKPNHPTFSDQSKYHGVDGHEGGSWNQMNDESWVFKPGASNLKNYSGDELRDYFKRVEPGNSVMIEPPASVAEPVVTNPGD